MVNVSEEEEESAIDRMLYIIKPHLPKLAVDALPRFIGNIKNVKSITDLKAYIVVEFYNKIDADAAKAEGFELIINDQSQKFNFATIGVLQVFMNHYIKESEASGY